MKRAFDATTEGFYLRTKSDGRLFNPARLRAKTKMREALVRYFMFPDDAAVATYSQHELLSMLHCFSQACKEFRLTWRRQMFWHRTQRHRQPSPSTTTNPRRPLFYEHRLHHHRQPLTRHTDRQDDREAATTPACITTRVWINLKLTVKTKMADYNACVISTLLYGRQSRISDSRAYLTPSTWETSAITWPKRRKTEHPTPRFCLVLAFPVCTLCSGATDCVGCVMYTAWTMAAS